MNGNLKYVLTALTIVVIIVGAALTFANKVDKVEMTACVSEVKKDMSDNKAQLRLEIKECEQRTLKLIENNQNEIKSLIRMLLKDRG